MYILCSINKCLACLCCRYCWLGDYSCLPTFYQNQQSPLLVINCLSKPINSSDCSSNHATTWLLVDLWFRTIFLNLGIEVCWYVAFHGLFFLLYPILESSSAKPSRKQADRILLMEEILHHLRLVVYPIIYMVLITSQVGCLRFFSINSMSYLYFIRWCDVISIENSLILFFFRPFSRIALELIAATCNLSYLLCSMLLLQVVHLLPYGLMAKWFAGAMRGMVARKVLWPSNLSRDSWDVISHKYPLKKGSI